MLNSLVAQQQQQAGGTLSIEQLLRAAKLIEQRAINDLLAAANPFAGSVPSNNLGFAGANFAAIGKLGEDYQERILASKMRASSAFTDNAKMTPSAAIYASAPPPNSTGSSRRSSPISAASSSPNSPDSTNPLCGRLNTPPMVQQQAMATTSGPQQHASASTSSSPSSSSGGGGNGRRAGGSSRQSRAAHNELEKNRRANLRGHLEALKSALPPESDSHRDTTLSLLTRARNHIRLLKHQKGALTEQRAALLAEHLHLRQLLQNGPEMVQHQQQPMELPAPKPVFPSPSSSVKAEPIRGEEEEGEQEEDEAIEAVADAKPDLDFLALNGLLPALPQLYPYASIPATIVPTPSGQMC